MARRFQGSGGESIARGSFPLFSAAGALHRGTVAWRAELGTARFLLRKQKWRRER